ncbi:MAG: DUF4349 domain-containing protein [Alphaproteobacteria bacterium]|nr:DUF4349 domain-containing protein [Alphaproteobacteria bacterium]
MPRRSPAFARTPLALTVCAFVALALAACGQAPKSERAMVAESPAMEAVAPAPVAAGAGAPADAAAAPAAEAGAPALPPGALLLAYDYTAEIEAPGRQIRPLMDAHVAACRAAGSARCMVLGSSVQSESDDDVTAMLTLRAEPKWLEAFRAGLAAQAKAANGRIISTSVSAEDLTREIVDVEARLRAQKTLRDRLQQLLRERPGKLSDLLETERELARVQGEIDSAQSQLAVMRQRVDMSKLDIAYRSSPVIVTRNTFDPVTNAGSRFLGRVGESVADVITFVAYAAPWALVLGPAIWFGARWWRRRRLKPPSS